jgi:methylenetetrahydrofolate reductase (NADPH)
VKIRDFFATDPCVLSFEVFPPVRDGTIDRLVPVIDRLAELDPHFISVTYGAGGGTRDMSVEIASLLKEKASVEVLAHLTCVGADREQIDGILRELRDKGVQNILALRGDPPAGETSFTRPKDGFGYACELVDFIRSYNWFCVGVAGYPEGHQEAESFEADIDHLKRKIDAGSDFVITQLFYRNEDFYRFRDAADRAGVNVPLVPGIFPVINYRQISKIVSLCGATLPRELRERIDPVRDDDGEVARRGIDYAVRQTEDLLQHGVPGLHFYSMNRSGPVEEILNGISLPGRNNI